MKFNVKSSPLISLIVLGLIIIIAIGAMIFYQLPTIRAIRTDLDATRLNLAIFQEDEANLKIIENQAKKAAADQSEFDKEIWSFSAEENFFDLWDGFGQANGVTVDLSQVAEVVPGKQPVIRAAALSMMGNSSNVLNAVNAIQQIKPLVAIQQITLRSGSASDQLEAEISFNTVWQ